jgi:hypothetical protein
MGVPVSSPAMKGNTESESVGSGREETSKSMLTEGELLRTEYICGHWMLAGGNLSIRNHSSLFVKGQNLCDVRQ